MTVLDDTEEIPRRIRAHHLHVGNRIVADDGTTAEVTHFEVTGEWVHYRTSDGEFVSIPIAEARKRVLRVLV